MDYKVRCIKVIPNHWSFKVGNVYTVFNKTITGDDGTAYSSWSFYNEGTLADLNRWFGYSDIQFELLNE